MLNFLKDNTGLPDQIKSLFNWFINESNKIWQDYDYKLYVASEEESEQLTQQVSQKRIELIKKTVNSFDNKTYTNLVEMLLNTLDSDSEKARSFSVYPNYYLKNIDTYLDCYSTIGAHAFIDTIIFDSIEDVNKNTILNQYKSFLDKQANALFNDDDQLEMIWDNVYFINIDKIPQLFHFNEIIEHSR